MYFSMVIAQSFLARTFGSYTMQLFGGDERGRMVPILGVSLILAAFMINLLGNRWIQGVASFIGILKIGGILASIFAVSRMLAMLTEMKLVPHTPKWSRISLGIAQSVGCSLFH